MFNTTDSQELTAQAGDQIRADITVDGGELSVQIQKEGEEPLYSGDGIVASCDFAIGIEESGTYTITVTGDKAEGSAHFEVVSFGSKQKSRPQGRLFCLVYRPRISSSLLSLLRISQPSSVTMTRSSTRTPNSPGR